MKTNRYAAVDLGASSGRVISGAISDSNVELTEVHRFANQPVQLPSGLHWDIVDLYRQILHGLGEAGAVSSFGIDSWAVDYGLTGEGGALLGLPYHYRDRRTQSLPPWPDPAGLYGITGIAELPFNTLHQLRTEPAARLEAAEQLLMIPDLLGFWLTGQRGGEVTNASTTQLYDNQSGQWSGKVAAAAGVPVRLLPKLRQPGEAIGTTASGMLLRAVASHDTASAIAAIPAENDRFAYISCGTWSLVGLELTAPVFSEAARRATFTNEAGVDGTIRFLRNVMGLWLLQECQCYWDEPSTGSLLEQAAAAQPFTALLDPQDNCWLSPGDEPGGMPARIAAHADGPLVSKGAVIRCVLESLAYGHRAAIAEAVALAGKPVEVVHLVGGGSRNALLSQLTADAAGLPVVAGPAEATALGNLLIQAGADGIVDGLSQVRALVRATQRLSYYEPRSARGWDEAAARIAAMSRR
jgi:rhamnulokinase